MIEETRTESFIVCLKDGTWSRVNVNFVVDVEIEDDTTSEELELYLRQDRWADRTDIAFIAHLNPQNLTYGLWEV